VRRRGPTERSITTLRRHASCDGWRSEENAMKRVISAASVAWVIASLGIIDCSGRTASLPGGESTGDVPNGVPSNPNGTSPDEAGADGGDGSTPSSFGEAGPNAMPDDAPSNTRADGASSNGPPNLLGDTGLPWSFTDGGFTFDSGTSYVFDSGVSVVFEDGGFTIH
jgi:hypothetical protein